MNRIASLIKKELRTNSYSLKGAFQVLFFLLISGVFFHSFVNAFTQLARDVSLYGGERPNLDNLIQAMFSNFQFTLLLLIPASTMGSISEERSKQTIRLLLSSPARSFEIVFSKFAANFLFLSFALLLSSVFFLYLSYYGNPDINLIFTSYFGLCLLVAAHTSLGIYISSLFKKQIISFLLSIMIMLGLMVSSWVSTKVAISESLSNFLAYIGTNTHIDPMYRGLIRTSDIVYFACFTILFLVLASSTLDKKEWK